MVFVHRSEHVSSYRFGNRFCSADGIFSCDLLAEPFSLDAKLVLLLGVIYRDISPAVLDNQEHAAAVKHHLHTGECSSIVQDPQPAVWGRATDNIPDKENFLVRVNN